MGKWLTQEWIDDTIRLADSMPEQPGLTAVVQYMITDGPQGDAEYYWDIVDGRLSTAGIGPAPAADVTLTISFDDAKAMQQGVIDANTAFMQGKIQVAGDMMKLLELLPVTSSQEYRALETELASLTEF